MTTADLHPPKPYYSFLHERSSYVSEEAFFDASQFDWARMLESKWDIIHSELEAYIGKNRSDLQPYFASHMMNQPGKWKVLSFFFWGLKASRATTKNCPLTMRTLEQIPGVVSASLSLMEPFSEIKEHYGDTDAIYRCHLPIEVPALLPDTGMQVSNERRSWEPGKILIFNDAATHRAWNRSPKERVILLIDVIKPAYLSQRKKICSNVFASLLMQKFGMGKWLPLQKKPLRLLVFHLFTAGMRIYFFFAARKMIWNTSPAIP